MRKAGWYVDPVDENCRRHWDGKNWSSSTVSNSWGPYAKARYARILASTSVILSGMTIFYVIIVSALVSGIGHNLLLTALEVYRSATYASFGAILLIPFMSTAALLLNRLKTIPSLLASGCFLVSSSVIFTLLNLGSWEDYYRFIGSILT